MTDTLALNTPQEGDIVDGKYKLRKKLGDGGFGVVFQAEHLELHDTFAIKFYLPKHGMHGPKEKERFLLEGRALRRIKSEYAVHVSDMGRFYKYAGGEEVPYIVMEYLDGQDLHVHAGNHPNMPVAVAIDYILQACIALSKAHAMQLIHRDLKPSNLFLTEQDGLPRVKVIDFGLAKDASPYRKPGSLKTESFQIIGTPPYMAPEQWGGLNRATQLTDIFALGVCLYYLLTLHEPFPGEHVEEINQNVVHRPPTPLRSYRQDIVQDLVDVVEQALAKDPQQRHASIVEFARALVPFGDARAALRLADVERAAEAGKSAAEKREERIETIEVVNPVGGQGDDTNKIFERKKDIPLPQGGTVAIGAQRKPPSRMVVAVSVVIILVTGMAGLVAKQVFSQPNEPATTSASAAPSHVPALSTASSAPTNSTSSAVVTAPPPTASASTSIGKPGGGFSLKTSKPPSSATGARTF